MEETNESVPVVTSNGVNDTNARTAWFEFILDESLLERHLSVPNAGGYLLTVDDKVQPCKYVHV